MPVQERAFISYSRKNLDFAMKFAKGLRSAGYSVWLDKLDIPTGSKWDNEVEKALRDCPVFILVLTPDSVASENVKDEIGYAIGNNKHIIPILLEKCEIPFRLQRYQYVDFTSMSFEEGFETAKELLGESSSTPVVEKTPAVESKSNQKAEQEKLVKLETERKAKGEADRLVAQKAKGKPVEAVPAEVKKETVSAAAAQKKPVSNGLVIGIVAVVVLVLGGIGYGKFLSPATKTASTKTSQPTAAPAVAGPLTTDTMSIDEVRVLNENTKRFSSLAIETYGNDKYYEIMESNNPVVYVENSTLEPLLARYFDCALSQELLDANWTNKVYTVELNGEVLPPSSFAYFSEPYNDGTNDWFCIYRVMVIGNWESGHEYSIKDYLTVINAYNDGVNDYQPGVAFTREFIVKIP